ncbi:MAG: hypothetical protein RIC80_04630 [Cyclobacteriaceae bacterium]
MFGWFKKKTQEPQARKLQDLNNNELAIGDEVDSLRYELGRCTVVETAQGIVYESQETKKQVHWTKMIDASTELQKVYKVDTR